LAEGAETARHGDSDHDLVAEVRTFLIADVRGYTRYTQDQGDEAAAKLAAKFAALTRGAVSARGGEVIELRGDEALCVFSSARQALRCALDLQSRFGAETAREPELPLPVGIGLDAGEAVRVEGGYRGGALNLAARLSGHANAGEVLATETVVHLARKIAGLTYTELGPIPIKGLTEPVRLVMVQREPDESVPPVPARQERAQPEGEPAFDSGAAVPVGGFLGASPEGVLVARKEELSRLTSALAAVEAGGGRLLLLTGEPGVGKTRLAQEMSLQARNRGFLVGTAVCYEQRQTVPFYPFSEALATLYAAGPPSIRQEAPKRWPYLGRLVRRQDFPSFAPEGEADEEWLFRTVIDFLQTLARLAPVAVMIDDLQWADESSLELLLYLARNARAARVLLLGAYREADVDAQHPLEPIVLELNRQQLIEWVTVRPFREDETALLVRTAVGNGDVPHDFVAHLHRRTEGNPFFTQEIVRSLVERGDLQARHGRWAVPDLTKLHVPTRVRAVVGQRLSRLQPVSREILQEASVLGQTFTFDHLQRVLARDEEELDAALDEAAKAGIIREVGADGYAFNYSLIRQTMYEQLSSRRRRRLHLAAGTALEQELSTSQSGRGAELAWHFLQGDDRERALSYAIIAGDEAEAVFAHREAERHYRTALELARAAGDTPREAQVLETLGGVLQIIGRYHEALETLEQAAQTYEAAADPDGESRVAAQIGSAYAHMGRPDEGLDRLQPLLGASAQHVAPRSNALVLIAQSQLSIAAARPRAGLAAAALAAGLAREADDKRILAEAELRRGEALAMLGDYEPAREVLEGVISLRTVSDRNTLVRALDGVGTVALLAGNFRQAKMYQQRALEIADQLGDPRTLLGALAALSRTFTYLGAWADARRLLERARDLEGTVGLTHFEVRIQVALAHLSLLEGKWETASLALDDAAEAATDGGLQRMWPVIACLADRDLLAHEFDSARERLESLLNQGLDELADSGELLLGLAEAHIGLGNLVRAEELVDQGLARSGVARNRLAFLAALSLRGIIRSRQNRTEEAGRLFEAALSLARGMPFPYQEGRVLYEYGIMMAPTLQVGRRHLLDALAMFERLGARKHAEWARHALVQAAGVQ
jgi:class 3 adenylate cyclase/tetratricopeptide (TPR) repeat protein